MKKSIVSGILLVTSLTAMAGTPLWMRDAHISPDGSRIAFTYMGDIYTVGTNGGRATRLTSRPGYESTPVWSPDGRWIAFRDNRSGNFDIYIMPSSGGVATRLTTNSANEIPETFSPDGKYVYFSAAIQDPASSMAFPSRRLTELYRVGIEGGAVEQVLATPAEMVSFLPDGSGFLYHDQKGMENIWRKHHTSSVTRDIWLYDANTGHHTNLTNRGGEDRNPVVTADGSSVIFLSERDGQPFNVWSMPINNPAAATQLTTFETHPVRFLSQADNGTLAFTWDGEIYTMRPGAAPEKVAVDIVVDNAVEPESVNVGNRNSEAAVSPDGKQMAVVSRGDIFITSTDYNSTRQITKTPQAEADVTWHPAGRKIAYTSERDGIKNIYCATIDRSDDPNFSNATTVTERALFDSSDGVERMKPRFSPDGDKLAYIKNRNTLVVKDMAGGAERQLTDGSLWPDHTGGFNYSWSPDSRYIALEVIAHHHDPYSDIAIIDTETGAMTLLTETGYFDMYPSWALDGNAVMFKSDRAGMRNHASWGSMEDVYLVFLNRDAYDRFRLSEEDYQLLKEVEKQQKSDKKDDKDKKQQKGKKEKKTNEEETPEDAITLEPEGIQERLVRLTPASSDLSGAIVTKDGESLYYLSAFEKGYDLWKTDLRKKETSLVKKLDSRDMAMEMDTEGRIYLEGSNALKRLEPKGDKITNITVSATQIIDPAAEREAMFDNVVVEERECFYTEDMHGVDWEALTDHYRRFLPHINNGYDYADMLSEMLGELNVSHTGSGYRASSSRTLEPTASLGLLYDMTWKGDGLKVDEIVKGGPFSRATSRLTPGCIIESINGSTIDPTTDHTALFNGLAKKKTLVGIYNPATASRWSEVVIPISSGAMDDLLYRRWVDRCEAIVDSLSGGRLGYVHIRTMNDASFREVYNKVLGKYYDREGIVIDTRWNGGGRLHEDIEVLFSGDKYLTQTIRGNEACTMPSRRWTKPSVMVICEANYSNAHGTPWVYKHEGIGKLVGAPVPGTMTSVNWATMQNPDFYFGIPVVGYRTADGTYLENSQLEPDILVLPKPEEIAAGIDRQLETAVASLLDDIDGK